MLFHVSGEHTVASMLSYRAAVTPQAPFLQFGDDGEPVVMTYHDVLQLGQAGAAVLASARVGRNDSVAVLLDNRAEFFGCWFGAAIVGAVLVPIGPGSSLDEVRYIVDHADCRAIVCTTEWADRLDGIPEVVEIVTVGADFDERAENRQPTQLADCAPLDPLAVLYTSGTTGRPKGVVITHANYLAAGQAVASALRIRPDDRWLVVLPLFHANAQFYCVMSALVSGASVAVVQRFSASRWSQQVRRHRATLASLFAAPIRMILTTAAAAGDDDNLLRATLFAQNLTAAELSEFEERFAVSLLQLYGMTETVIPPLMNPLYGSRDNMTLGLPLFPNAIRIQRDDGNDAAVGETGELLVAGIPGVTVMAGYLHDRIASADAFRDGWLHTEDLVTARSDGHIEFCDRKKHMIKRAGENVAAAEVERVLNDHSAVYESAAIGEPDPIRDEQIRAFVVCRPGCSVTAEELIAHCGRSLAPFKVPSAIDFVADLPHTAVGKIQKHRLAEQRQSTR